MKVLLNTPVMLVVGTALFCFFLKAAGVPTVEKRIVGGEDDREKKDRPFFVLLNIYVVPMENPRSCGGVFIDADIVLTAARCFRPYENLINVIAQKGNFRKEESKEEIEAVSVKVYDKIIGFNKIPGKGQHPPDIARVRLASKVAGKEDVLHLCGAAFWKTFLPGKQLATVGMGSISSDDRNSFAEVLERLNIEVTETHGKCGKVRHSKVYDSNTTFCAGGLVRRFMRPDYLGICEGDEGGPVFHTNPTDDAECLVGVLNEGIGTLDNPNNCEGAVLFTSVKYLENWIEKEQLKQIFQNKVPEVIPRSTTRKSKRGKKFLKFGEKN